MRETLASLENLLLAGQATTKSDIAFEIIMAIMKSELMFATLLYSVNLISASPHAINDAVRRDVKPTCKGCWALSPGKPNKP
jgi:hypothetical protein